MPSADLSSASTVRTFTVGRGARIVVLPTSESAGVDARGRSTSAGVVAIQLWVGGGTAAEGPDEHGCAHLLEHMLFKPTAEGHDLAAAIEGLGGDINAFTSHDETVVHATVPAGREHQALQSLLPPVLCPQLEPEALATEIGVVVEEIHQYRDDPGTQAMQSLHEALHGRHPYARTVLGTAAEVRSHTAARLRRFHRRVYAARRVYLVVVGPVDPEAIVRIATPWLERLPAGRRVDDGEVVTEPLTRARVRVGQAEMQEAHVQLAWRAPPVPAVEACALEVASIVLGHGEASRLTRSVRRGQQLVTDVHASFYLSRRASALVVSAHGQPQTIERATAAIVDQVERLCRVPLATEELARARAVLRSDLVYRRETAQGQAHALGQNLSLAGSLELEPRYYEALEGLDVGQIRRAAATWLRPNAAAVSVIVPPTTVARRRALRAGLRRSVTARAKRPTAVKVKRDRQGVVSATLPGGLRVLANVDARVPMAAGWVLWPGGQRREDARRHGASAMMAALLTRGCGAIGGDELAREIEGQAAVLDGFASRNSAGLHFECMSSSVPQVLRRAIECALAPSFAEAELEEERRVALQDYETERDDPAKLAFTLAVSRLYRRHPFGRRRHGTPDTIRSFTSRGLRKAWSQWYPLGRAILAVSGDVDIDGMLGVLEALVPDTEPPPAMPPWPGSAPAYPRRAVELFAPLKREQSHLVLSMPGLALGDPRAPALDLLLAVLGGQAGRLFMALREAEGLVYHVAANSNEGVDAGDLLFYAASSPERMGRARQVLEGELKRICDERVGDEELSRAKVLLLGQYAMGMERHGRRASLLAFNETFGLGRHDHLRYPARVEKIGARTLRTLARELLDPTRRVQAVVGPTRIR
ncbi:MAG: pitrilysin family protein [Myxococcota bacterium]